jgi:hypothetical protein
VEGGRVEGSGEHFLSDFSSRLRSWTTVFSTKLRKLRRDSLVDNLPWGHILRAIRLGFCI